MGKINVKTAVEDEIRRVENEVRNQMMRQGPTVMNDDYCTTKDIKGKPNYMLVPIKGLLDAIEEVREYGLIKYPDPENWKTVPAIEYWKAFERHVAKAWNDPDAIDPESGCKHSHHAAFNLACWLYLEGER